MIYDVTRAIASALATSSAIDTRCRTSWARPLRVCIDSRGEFATDPSGGFCPYAIVSPSGDAAGGKETGEDLFEIAIRTVIDASSDEGVWRDAAKPVQDADGVWECGAGHALEELVDLIRGVAGADGHGALFRASRVEWDGHNLFPLQFADLYLTFYRARAF